MSDDPKPSGPDLEAGVALDDLEEGKPLLGHAGGEPVILVRRGAGAFALGAACTHYGGPLAEGLVVGDTVRCPWHHACFGLASGEALRAPALNPVACYEVHHDGDRVRVGGKRPPPAPPVLDEQPEAVVIVGAGAAGNAAAEALRKGGYTGPLQMIGADDALPYDRPNLSKDYLAGSAPEEWIPLHPRDFYDERKIELILGTRVAALDLSAREVRLADGRTIPFGPRGALVLATGAEPRRPQIPGADLPHVRLLRTLADSRAIVELAARAKNVVVLGASFIGLETAAALRARGLAVTIVAPDERPLGRILGHELAAFVRRLHEEHGVVFRLETKAERITATEVELAGGERLPADLVVAGIGVQPRIELADEAGLEVDNGVRVDNHLQTSARAVYAAGDIANWPDPRTGERLRVEHWVVAERQGQTAAANILGRREDFAAAPFFWSQHYDVQISYVGYGSGWESTELSGSLAERNATVVFRKGDEIVAVATVGRDRQSLEVELAMERGDRDALAIAAGAVGAGIFSLHEAS
jgi:NADPH-dependent 2,4-dienoyl-CoA reductase/sulfur reductase-like enzyme/nitrite reductase/ring-hydroxylating ferredoxin subunit